MSIVAVLFESTTTTHQHHNTSHTTYNTPKEKTPCYTSKSTVSHHNTSQFNTAIIKEHENKQKSNSTRNRGLHTCCCRRSCCSPPCELWITLDSRSTLLPAELADNVAAMFSPNRSVPVRGNRFKASCKRETQSAIAFLLEGGVSFTRYLQGDQNTPEQTRTDQGHIIPHHYIHTLHLIIPIGLKNKSHGEMRIEKAARTTDTIT